MSESSDYDLEGSIELNNVGTYEGERNEEGERHGKGKANFPNGDRYEGGYAAGLRNGQGVYRFKNAKFDGYYKDGKRHGEGKMYYPDGSTYTGTWNEGDKNGKGIYTYPNGDSYDGEWKDDQKHGKGVYTYNESGTIFTGQWNEGVRDGPGEWLNKEHKFQGFFRQDQPSGRGKFIFNTGCEQTGFYTIANISEAGESGEKVNAEAKWTCNSLRGVIN